MSYTYDVAVLGGGPGGYEAAIRCAQYGLHTALIEARELGGTCLNRGCIPTKALLHGAEVWETVEDAGTFGVKVGEKSLDFAALATFKDRQVTKLRKGIEALEKANGVTVVKGRGTLADAHTIAVGDEKVTAEKIILAMGSEPSKPPIAGIENAMTSDDVLAMTALPASVNVIGGGVIGIEFATLLSTLGAKVTVLEMLPDILPGVDPEINALLRGVLKKKKVDIINEAKVLSISDKHAVEYELKGEKKVAEADACIVCVGRRPMTKDLGLDAVGVKMERGFVQVDDHLQTSVANLYAIGDITGKIQLAHVASAQGLVAAANCAGKGERMDYRIVPACIYTHPEIAYVGLSEKAATEKGYTVRIGKFDVGGNGRSAVMYERTGLAKIVTDEKTGEILGAQVMSPCATDMIAEIAAVMRCEGTIEELADTIHPHPTVSEIIMEAAHDVDGLSCSAMPRKK